MIPSSPASRARKKESNQRAKIHGRKPAKCQTYLAWLRKRFCAVCMGQPVDPAHIGKAGKGMRQKGSDFESIPLCRFHHHELDHKMTANHGNDFFEKYSINRGTLLEILHHQFRIAHPIAAKQIPGMAV